MQLSRDQQKVYNNKARRTVYNLFEKILKEREDGTCTYEEPWTDEMVVKKIAKEHPKAKITVGKVSGIRNRGWGELYKIKTDKQIIADLQQTIIKQQEEIQQLKSNQGKGLIDIDKHFT